MNLFDLEPQQAGDLQSAIWSFREARILQVAVRLKLFTALHEQPQSTQQLAAALKTDPAMTERLLVALATMDLLVHDEGTWRNCFVATLHLVEGQPLYQGDLIEMAAREWALYDRLEQLVRQGKQGKRYEQFRRQQDERDERYLKAAYQLAVAGRAQRLARMVQGMAGRRTLLDVGGAPGTYSIAVCERHPAIEATILEQEDTVSLTTELIEQFDLSDRMTVKVADWQKERFGRDDYEALSINGSLLSSEDEALMQLVKAYEALKPGGLLIVQRALLDNDLNAPRWAAFSQLLDEIFTVDQMRSVIAEAGFERTTLLYRDRYGDVLQAFKPLDSSMESPSELMEHVSPEQEIFALMGLGEEESGDSLSVQRRMWKHLVQTN